jgi:hypothetical protein
MPAPPFYDKTYMDAIETRLAALEAANSQPAIEPRVAAIENTLEKVDAALQPTPAPKAAK